MVAIIIRQFDRVEKCNSLFYKHFSAVSVTELYFTYILFIRNFVPTSRKIANVLCQNVFIAFSYNPPNFHTMLPFRQIFGKPCFRLNIKWDILSYCPLKCMCPCHNSFSSIRHILMSFHDEVFGPLSLDKYLKSESPWHILQITE